MSDTKNRHEDRLKRSLANAVQLETAQRLFVRQAAQHGAERERRAIIADLRTEAGAYGGTIGEVLLAVAMRIETGAK